MTVRITGINETTLVMPSPNRNANLSFAAMTASAVVVHTDAMRNGRPLVGVVFFISIGRYGHGGLARERFIPRLLADPDDYCDGQPQALPDACLRGADAGRETGGHGDRAGAVGLLDSALWDWRPSSRTSRYGVFSRSALAPAMRTPASPSMPAAGITAMISLRH